MGNDIKQHEALDIILRYLLDNKKEDTPIHSSEIWQKVFPETEEEVVYFLLKEIIGTQDKIVVAHIRSDDVESFDVLFEANAITKRFLENQGGFTKQHIKSESEAATKAFEQVLVNKALEDQIQTNKINKIGIIVSIIIAATALTVSILALRKQ